MKTTPKPPPRTSRRAPILLATLVFLIPACGESSEGVDPNDRLCRGNSGFGARVTGAAEPIDICVLDDASGGGSEVHTTYNAQDTPGRYHITATVTRDSVDYEFRLSFLVHSSLPRALTVSSSQAQAFSDADGVWLFYREEKAGVFEHVASRATGLFTLTFSDETVAAGTFSGIEIDLEDAAGGSPVGRRNVAEGFFAVTPDP